MNILDQYFRVICSVFQYIVFEAKLEIINDPEIETNSEEGPYIYLIYLKFTSSSFSI